MFAYTLVYFQSHRMAALPIALHNCLSHQKDVVVYVRHDVIGDGEVNARRGVSDGRSPNNIYTLDS